jgi:magnesium-transporting ATPase (P-type)
MNLATRDESHNAKNLTTSKDSILALNNMASCHSIMNLQGTNKLIGDPMEIKLFEFGRFNLTKSSTVSNNFR